MYQRERMRGDHRRTVTKLLVLNSSTRRCSSLFLTAAFLRFQFFPFQFPFANMKSPWSSGATCARGTVVTPALDPSGQAGGVTGATTALDLVQLHLNAADEAEPTARRGRVASRRAACP